MNANEYQKLAMRTNDRKATDRLNDKIEMIEFFKDAKAGRPAEKYDLGGIFNAAFGLSGEVGEFNDMLKKWVFHEKELVDPILNRGVVMGEGWLLPAEVAELIELGYNNVICVQPFGCLPNHIVGKGTIRVLREKYKDANIFPIDYDSSASTVNQENRIKLMLSMAREKM